MRERISMVGGELEMQSAKGSGVSIRAVFPLQASLS
jgi:signal transduction histidine kinase